MKNFYRFIIPRLNADEIRKNFSHYLFLVRKGVAGFIVFGGKLEELREYIKKLQEEAELPLVIASDLEQGLGQQVKGGTLFPPAMALASAIRKNPEFNAQGPGTGLLWDVFKAFALEAGYAGINTILAPVLDINTNRRNPIISVRAFGEKSDTVSFFGCGMIRTIQNHDIAACGKHFPGHGDTETDSHIMLPTIKKDLDHLRKNELQPFKRAIKAGVRMIMLGHLSVPAIDPSGIPVSVSEKAVKILREEMGYKGLLITDALNMGGLGGYSEEEAAFTALNAGVDIILHPADPEKTASYLKGKNVFFDADRLDRFRKGLIGIPTTDRPDFAGHGRLSSKLAGEAIRTSGHFRITGRPFLIILNDDENDPSRNPASRGEMPDERNDDLFPPEKGRAFAERLKKYFPGIGLRILSCVSGNQEITLPDEACVIVAIFCETKAWKGGASGWLHDKIASLENSADLFVSFGSPYLLDDVHCRPAVASRKSVAKIFAYWDAVPAQEAAAGLIAGGFS